MKPPRTTPSSLGIRLIPALLLLTAGLLPANGHADEQIFDDLIVHENVCIGQPCADGEVFGFASLKLKEDNLRIEFQDTSVSAAFPTKNWELRANSRFNGGEEYFGIVDMDDLSQTCVGGNNDGADCTSNPDACGGSCVDGPSVGASCFSDSSCGPATCVGGTNDGAFCVVDSMCAGGTCNFPYTCSGIGTCSEPGNVIFRVGGDAPAESLTIDSAGVVSAPAGAVVSTGLEVVGSIGVTGTVDGRDVSADGATLDGISGGISTNASNISANTTAIAGKADASAVAANTTAIGNNTTDVATNKTAIDTHVGDTSNPHNVTAAQLGIPSGPGGDLQAGILEQSDFTTTGSPRTAEVTFSSPRTQPYVLVLGLVSKNAKLLGNATILEQRADGFTVGMPKTNMRKLVQLNWMVVTP
ncbi:MAG: hypothetical protein P8R42_04820 [Candidatus Binatia bacterium]|nr:hypothetical protein [Candidatus Binatia bacterium]